MHRVQKILSNSGFCSRRKAEELIKQGRVKVNNKVISIGDQAKDEDKIYVDGKLIKKQKKIYLMFHKPMGCVTALTDEYRKTIMDYIHVDERVFPVGRLDHNASGLILLTNDGDFAQKIAHPRFETKKTYLVGLDHPIKDETIWLQKGIVVDRRRVRAKVRKINPKTIEITIHEGRHKIVKRLLKQVGFRVTTLKRIRIGNLRLGNLKAGAYKILKKEDLDKVFD